MAKRELISREEALSHPFANGKYDRKNADINFILGHESYNEWLETLPVLTEQDIVKPYLEKIRAEIMKLDDINPDYPMDRAIHISRNEVLQIIDKYKAESEEENDSKRTDK